MTCVASRHGTLSAYQRHRCRCPEAREAWRLYGKRARQGRPEVRRVPALGTVRRIQALWAIGHTSTAIGAVIGRTAAHVTTTVKDRTWVSPRTAAAYREAYDRLSMLPGTSDRNRSQARTKGWAPPLAWDEGTIDDPAAKPRRGAKRRATVDHAAVELTITGTARAATTRADRRAVVERMTAAGASAALIAERLGVKPEAVERARDRMKTKAA